MPSFQVTHATPDRSDADRRIDLIGGPLANGGGWYMTQEDAIAYLKVNPGSLYVYRRPMTENALAGGRTPLQNALIPVLSAVKIVVVPATPLAREHLATEADGVLRNNLGALPAVPLGYTFVRWL